MGLVGVVLALLGTLLAVNVGLRAGWPRWANFTLLVLAVYLFAVLVFVVPATFGQQHATVPPHHVLP
jgi:cell shape-determining protein MreD